jgi:DNA-binding NarL/FixJ family response regulator
MKPIKVAIVDTQGLFRQGVIALLQQMPEMEVIADDQNGIALLKTLESLYPLPDVLLMDMEIYCMSALDLNRRLRSTYPKIKVIILSAFNKGGEIYKMVEEGICGYLSKSCSLEELKEAIEKVYTSGFFFPESIKDMLQKSSGYKANHIETFNHTEIELTNREKEIIQLICQELTNSEIAEKLFISPRTVEGHRNNLLMKTGSKNTAGLVVFAIRNHIYQIPAH